MTASKQPPKRVKPEWAIAIEMRRTRLQLSQELVAEKAEMSQSYYSDVERGHKSLLSLTAGKLFGLARALEWSLAEMQNATGVDFGIREVTPLPGNEAIPIYLLQDLTNPDAQPDSYGFFAPSTRFPNPANFRVVYMDSDEMTTTEGQSIFKDACVFLDLGINEAADLRKTYAIEFKGRIHIRRLTELPTGKAFTADNPAYSLEFIPADQVKVIGKTYRINLDTAQRPNKTIN